MCDVVTPLPVLPSPKLHEYEVAFDDVLASNEHFRLEQLNVNLATGAGAEGSLTVTDRDAVLLPFASVTVSTIV